MSGLPIPGAMVAGKYRVESLLGTGGMGAVFRAHHVLMDKVVALKWLRPELSPRENAKERFVREAQAAARIRHPNVVEVYDVGAYEGSLFMVMELLEGRGLRELLERGALSTSYLLRLLMGAMEGVAAAHEHGIVHRDIKPDNIFVVRGPRPAQHAAKILDFGISKSTDQRWRKLTQSGRSIGTPGYMSIEQMIGAADVDGRADVYAFGVLLYRSLTGRQPFQAASPAELVAKIASYRPPPPRVLRPELPAVLDGIVMKAMAFRREQRYPSMRALIDALRASGVVGPTRDPWAFDRLSERPVRRSTVAPTRTAPHAGQAGLAQAPWETLGDGSTEQSSATTPTQVFCRRSPGRAVAISSALAFATAVATWAWALSPQHGQVLWSLLQPRGFTTAPSSGAAPDTVARSQLAAERTPSLHPPLLPVGATTAELPAASRRAAKLDTESPVGAASLAEKAAPTVVILASGEQLIPATTGARPTPSAALPPAGKPAPAVRSTRERPTRLRRAAGRGRLGASPIKKTGSPDQKLLASSASERGREEKPADAPRPRVGLAGDIFADMPETADARRSSILISDLVDPWQD